MLYEVITPALERTISLHNIHTGESLQKVVFWSEGEYIEETLKDVNFLLRDYRNDQVKTIRNNFV